MRFFPEIDVGIEPELRHVLGRHAKGVGLKLNRALTAGERIAGDRINVRHLLVGHGETTGGRADAVHHDIAAGPPVCPVIGIG